MYKKTIEYLNENPNETLLVAMQQTRGKLSLEEFETCLKLIHKLIKKYYPKRYIKGNHEYMALRHFGDNIDTTLIDNMNLLEMALITTEEKDRPKKIKFREWF